MRRACSLPKQAKSAYWVIASHFLLTVLFAFTIIVKVFTGAYPDLFADCLDERPYSSFLPANRNGFAGGSF